MNSARYYFSMLVLVVLVLLAASADATVEYAGRTGLGCGVCHVNQLGGGELTPVGDAFLAGLSGKGGYTHLSTPKRVVRLVVGYMHILAGVVWFGTIFYIHILLKPAYAAKGLPRGELVLGWTCIIIVGITGTLLTGARMQSIDAFYTTRFGLLLSVKIFLFLVMASTAGIATFIIGPRLKARKLAGAGRDGVFTPEGLRGFDGREGSKAYVAVEGTVYDVTESRLWKNGRHTRHLAGDDMTDMIKQAPHGPEKLSAMPVVGRLVDTAPAPPSRPKAVFYFMAYMNLVFVFIILGIVALWRWW